MIGTIEQVISDMKAGVYDHTKGGECSGCGQCCADFLPISQGEIKRIRKYVRDNRITEQKHIPPTVEPVEDWTCPFRNDMEQKCEIYPVRPAICRDFRCDKPRKQIEADKKLYHGKYSVVRMRETFFGEGKK